MNQHRYLIVNADDFGQSHGVNRGIIEAFQFGILTSTSVMVRWPALDEAVSYSRDFPGLALGLHLDLSEWAYRNEEWVCLYQVVDESDANALRRELRQQLEAFYRAFGKNPTHIDSHQHVHVNEPLRMIAAEMADEINVPLRHITPAVQYCGAFYGQTSEGYPYQEAIGVDALIRTLEEIPPGLTELACHPGYGEDLDTMYREERAIELATLCDVRVRGAIQELGIQLVSFAEYPAMFRD
jgi:chitin disaccharide deacetylase